MKDKSQILHEVSMQILDFQIAAILEQNRHAMAAIVADTKEEKEIHLSHAATQVDIIAMLEKLLTTTKGE